MSGCYSGIETRENVSLFDCLVNEIEIAPVLLAAQSRDLDQYELEVLEKGMELRIFRGRRRVDLSEHGVDRSAPSPDS